MTLLFISLRKLDASEVKFHKIPSRPSPTQSVTIHKLSFFSTLDAPLVLLCQGQPCVTHKVPLPSPVATLRHWSNNSSFFLPCHRHYPTCYSHQHKNPLYFSCIIPNPKKPWLPFLADSSLLLCFFYGNLLLNHFSLGNECLSFPLNPRHQASISTLPLKLLIKVRKDFHIAKFNGQGTALILLDL